MSFAGLPVGLPQRQIFFAFECGHGGKPSSGDTLRPIVLASTQR